jgi:hypothetical protein
MFSSIYGIIKELALGLWDAKMGEKYKCLGF